MIKTRHRKKRVCFFVYLHYAMEIVQVHRVTRTSRICIEMYSKHAIHKQTLKCQRRHSHIQMEYLVNDGGRSCDGAPMHKYISNYFAIYGSSTILETSSHTSQATDNHITANDTISHYITIYHMRCLPACNRSTQLTESPIQTRN